MNIGNYTVDLYRFLGKGGFGDVYVASDENNTLVAAKRVWLKAAEIEDIEGEVRTLRKVEPHPNVLGYMGAARSKDCLWIFTEYCEKGDLSKYWLTHKLELTHIIQIAYQCACAINHLHTLVPCLVHRDMKPQNILMTHKRSGLEVKLADFGLAKTSALIGQTLAMRTICGTEYYMAPEFFLIKRFAVFSYGRSVDIFAMGMVLAELLNAAPGKPLIPLHDNGKAVGESMNRMLENNMVVWCPVTVSEDDSILILRLKAVASMMLRHDPNLRPTAQTAMQKLKAILDDAPKVARLPRNTEAGADQDEQVSKNGQETDQEATHFIQGYETVRNSPTRRTIRLYPNNEAVNSESEDELEVETVRHNPNYKTVHPKSGVAKQPKPGVAKHPKSGVAKHPKSDITKKQMFQRATPHQNIRGTIRLSSSNAQDIQEKMACGGITRLRGLEFKYVLVGGSNRYRTSELCWELDTPEDGFFWKVFAEFPEAIRGLHGRSICSIDDESFAIAGGSRSSKCQLVCYKYSVKSKWQELPEPIIARCSAGLVCLNNVLYYIGGEGDDKKIIKACEKLHLKAVGLGRSWLKCRDMLQKMVFPLVATASGNIYVVSNTHRDNRIQPGTAVTLQCFDPEADEWNYRASLPYSVRDTSGATIVGDAGFLYLLAGWEKLCVRYSVRLDSWTLLKPCQAVHTLAAACCSDGKINVFGGRDEQGPSTRVSEYDIKNDEWRERTLELPESIVCHHALVLHMQGGGPVLAEEDETGE